MNTLKRMVLLGAMWAATAWAQGNIEINTPAISQIKSSMQARHTQLAAHYASGAVGLGADGNVVLRDANAVPLAQRQAVQGLVAQENTDRAALYREIARANGHPEWEADIRSTFAQRWIERAQSGWYIQSGGQWSRK
ncbi:YdbL family protein [Methyloversatilis sp. MC4-4]|uniref:YdbL family protein n=1 Tax=Methyloversatilis sp. MC4-4 TaxID=3132824 RepID=UPI003CEE5CE4